MKRAYQTLLRLYPADYKASFAAEMLNTFVKRAEECRAQRPRRLLQFGLVELMSVTIGAVIEWTSKLTTDRSVRGRYLPDLRMMRPAGVPQRSWFAGACASVSSDCTHDELCETEKRIEILIGQTVHAIANHDFPKARFYSEQERTVREHLRRLQN